MRLIDADEVYKVLTDYYHHRTEIQHEALKEAIDRVPTVDTIEVVAKNETTTEVVKCKDCKHRDPEDHKCDSGALERAGCLFPVADDYFCSYGERREEEGAVTFYANNKPVETTVIGEWREKEDGTD